MITYRNLGQCGRIGNALWELAATLGIGVTQDEGAILPPWDYQPYFNVPDELFGPVPDGAKEATEYVPHMDQRAKAYLQDYHLFENIQNTIKEYLQPSELAQETLKNPRVSWFHDLVDPIALHVRRGDNVIHPAGYHPLRTLDYYWLALERLPEENPIVVFSDDAEWCREFVVTDRNPVYYMEGNPTRPQEHLPEFKGSLPMDWVDLQLMAQCRYHIIANSSYSWWGAFLSENPSPIYPSNWFGWRVSDYTDSRLMFPSTWTEVADATQGGVTRRG